MSDPITELEHSILNGWIASSISARDNSLNDSVSIVDYLQKDNHNFTNSYGNYSSQHLDGYATNYASNNGYNYSKSNDYKYFGTSYKDYANDLDYKVYNIERELASKGTKGDNYRNNGDTSNHKSNNKNSNNHSRDNYDNSHGGSYYNNHINSHINSYNANSEKQGSMVEILRKKLRKYKDLYQLEHDNRLIQQKLLEDKDLMIRELKNHLIEAKKTIDVLLKQDQKYSYNNAMDNKSTQNNGSIAIESNHNKERELVTKAAIVMSDVTADVEMVGDEIQRLIAKNKQLEQQLKELKRERDSKLPSPIETSNNNSLENDQELVTMRRMLDLQEEIEQKLSLEIAELKKVVQRQDEQLQKVGEKSVLIHEETKHNYESEGSDGDDLDMEVMPVDTELGTSVNRFRFRISSEDIEDFLTEQLSPKRPTKNSHELENKHTTGSIRFVDSGSDNDEENIDKQAEESSDVDREVDISQYISDDKSDSDDSHNIDRYNEKLEDIYTASEANLDNSRAERKNRKNTGIASDSTLFHQDTGKEGSRVADKRTVSRHTNAQVSPVQKIVDHDDDSYKYFENPNTSPLAAVTDSFIDDVVASYGRKMKVNVLPTTKDKHVGFNTHGIAESANNINNESKTERQLDQSNKKRNQKKHLNTTVSSAYGDEDDEDDEDDLEMYNRIIKNNMLRQPIKINSDGSSVIANSIRRNLAANKSSHGHKISKDRPAATSARNQGKEKRRVGNNRAADRKTHQQPRSSSTGRVTTSSQDPSLVESSKPMVIRSLYGYDTKHPIDSPMVRKAADQKSGNFNNSSTQLDVTQMNNSVGNYSYKALDIIKSFQERNTSMNHTNKSSSFDTNRTSYTRENLYKNTSSHSYSSKQIKRAVDKFVADLEEATNI